MLKGLWDFWHVLYSWGGAGGLTFDRGYRCGCGYFM